MRASYGGQILIRCYSGSVQLLLQTLYYSKLMSACDWSGAQHLSGNLQLPGLEINGAGGGVGKLLA